MKGHRKFPKGSTLRIQAEFESGDVCTWTTWPPDDEAMTAQFFGELIKDELDKGLLQKAKFAKQMEGKEMKNLSKVTITIQHKDFQPTNFEKI